MRLVLASGSPRRAALLSAAGIPFVVRVADVDERLLAGETPREHVRRLAEAKARAVCVAQARPTDDLVLAADTVVVLDEAILGKPRDETEAATMLNRLSGRLHEVLTGVAVVGHAYQEVTVETTRVWVAPLLPADITWYVASGEPRDKAGAYAIQGLASRFVTRIDGSYTNVVGLPVAPVVQMLRRARFPLLAP
ncbi:MAG: septum formation inhibitor Maf [Luteitalea sp.]|nr:septum formation inhibitor Maf [Luteitalea sp.]